MATPPRGSASPFDALRDAVFRAPANAGRRSRAVIDAAIRQLLDAAVTTLQGSEPGGQDRYRIDDLARESGITTRNIRAYQERGLLPPPLKSGRVAYYDQMHVARLGMITSMLERGYTLAHIGEMLAAWQGGRDLAGILGLELVRPWAADPPTTMPVAQLRELAGDAAGLDRLVADGLVELRDDDALVYRPKLLRAFAETRSYGMSMESILEVHERVAPLVDQIAGILVDAGSAHIAATKPAVRENILDERTMADFVATLVRIRTLASDSVRASLESAIEGRIESSLGDYLSGLATRHDSTTSTR